MITDEALYQQIVRGEISAFDVLYERYRIRLFRFIYSYLKNEQEAEDLFHEAFLKVLKSTELDFEKGTFQAWIFETSRNLCLNRIRTHARANKATQTMPKIQESMNAETLFSSRQVSSQIAAAVKDLPELQMEVLHLKLLGASEKEIAQTLQIPIGTVKSRFHKMIERIRQEVKE